MSIDLYSTEILPPLILFPIKSSSLSTRCLNNNYDVSVELTIELISIYELNYILTLEFYTSEIFGCYEFLYLRSINYNQIKLNFLILL